MSKRQSELKILNEYLLREGNQLLILYGEQGVGKTTLVKDFINERSNVCFFDCSVVSEREQLYLWSKKIQKENIQFAEYPSMSEFFDVVKGKSQQDEKQIIIFDEFQRIAKGSEEFINHLFTYFQTSRNDIMVILCSSTVEWIENSMIKKFGLRAKNITGFLKVKELSFGDFVREFPQFTLNECLIGYSVFGGIPAIWKLLDKKLSLKENIIQNICNQNSLLFHYGEWIIERSLRETSVYNTILSAMANGKHKLNELYQHTGFSRAKISVYIKNLMELGILEKDNSIDTEGRDNLLKGIYSIKHPFVNFTYRFLFPNKEVLTEIGAEQFYQTYIKSELNSFAQNSFCNICREYIELENKKGNLPFLIKSVGKWTGKAGNIDILAFGEDGKTLIGLCNLDKPMMKFEDYEWLLFCAKQAKVSADYVYLISAGGFDEKLHLAQKSRANIRLLTPDKM